MNIVVVYNIRELEFPFYILENFISAWMQLMVRLMRF
jgi:hypothetical protein